MVNLGKSPTNGFYNRLGTANVYVTQCISLYNAQHYNTSSQLNGEQLNTLYSEVHPRKFHKVILHALATEQMYKLSQMATAELVA